MLKKSHKGMCTVLSPHISATYQLLPDRSSSIFCWHVIRRHIKINEIPIFVCGFSFQFIMERNEIMFVKFCSMFPTKYFCVWVYMYVWAHFYTYTMIMTVINSLCTLNLCWIANYLVLFIFFVCFNKSNIKRKTLAKERPTFLSFGLNKVIVLIHVFLPLIL